MSGLQTAMPRSSQSLQRHFRLSIIKKHRYKKMRVSDKQKKSQDAVSEHSLMVLIHEHLKKGFLPVTWWSQSASGSLQMERMRLRRNRSPFPPVFDGSCD